VLVTGADPLDVALDGGGATGATGQPLRGVVFRDAGGQPGWTSRAHGRRSRDRRRPQRRHGQATYAGWKGSLPEEEVRARVDATYQALMAPAEKFDPTRALPGWFAGDPPAEFVSLLEEMAAAVRPASMRTALPVMAKTDQRDLLPRVSVPTLLIWGELDSRSPLSVARQFERAIPDTKLIVIAGAGHVSNLEQPERFNEAVRDFCRANPPHQP
jgi:pimeloyl-ACP methyl ester carboxylesterase